MIIAVTGNTEPIYSERALNSGMNFVLFKPIEWKVLKDLVNKVGFISHEDEQVRSDYRPEVESAE